MATQLYSPAVAALPVRHDADAAGGAARFGWIVAVLFFGLLLGWAAFARLDAAAYASGSITVAGSRQAVQHKDGGIIGAIHVREGQRVHAGDVLIELAAGDVIANERALAATTIRLEAERARLLAEQSGGAIVTPAEFAGLSGDDRAEADQAMVLQRHELEARRRAISDQKRVLASQEAELGQQINGTSSRMRFNGDQHQLYDDQIAGMTPLADQGYISRNRVRELERQRADVDGQIAGLASSAAAAREEIGEKRMQALTVQSQYAEKASGELRDTEASLGEVLPKYRAAHQLVEQTRIRATATGQVVGLQVFTVGGVIEPGQKLMEIVPDKAPLVVEAQLSPDDADDVHVGLPAQVRVTAIHDRGIAPLEGTVTRMSADVFHDDKTGRAFYTVVVTVPAARLAELDRYEGRADALKPGLPVQVLVTLRRRTMLSYLFEPLFQATWRSMHEH